MLRLLILLVAFLIGGFTFSQGTGGVGNPLSYHDYVILNKVVPKLQTYLEEHYDAYQVEIRPDDRILHGPDETHANMQNEITKDLQASFDQYLKGVHFSFKGTESDGHLVFDVGLNNKTYTFVAEKTEDQVYIDVYETLFLQSPQFRKWDGKYIAFDTETMQNIEIEPIHPEVITESNINDHTFEFRKPVNHLKFMLMNINKDLILRKSIQKILNNRKIPPCQ